MKKLRNFIIAGILFSFYQVKAQHVFVRHDSVEVYYQGEELLNPWAGGLNSTQFSDIDFDFDGMKDIVAFDRGSFKLRCFKNTGGPGFTRYKHAPQYESYFPRLNDWCLFIDYNNDGKEDIFSYSIAGFQVHKNISPASGPIQFTQVYSLVYSNYNPGGTPNMLNLYCSSVGFPAIADIDDDGDIDVLTFSVFGTTIEYHKNKAVEYGLPLDTLKFEMVDDCWGDFTENSCASTLSFCPQFFKWKEITGAGTKANLHSGSCLTCLDADGDSDQDLILGDISCDSLEFFLNNGDKNIAHSDSTTKKFPPNKPVKMSYFPCTYYLDTDNDGARDLLVSPNNSVSAENFVSGWRYKNLGNDSAPVFIFEEFDFLQDSMLDFGEGAFPAILDENGDGLYDIIVGNTGYFTNGIYSSKLALLRNIGTATDPRFTLISRDYAGLSSYNIQNMAPAFGDLDGDLDLDLLVGDYNGQLTYFKNNGGVGNPINLAFTGTFWNSIDVPGNYAIPQIIDINKDGLNDILLGSRNGKLYYYENTGTISSPVFSSTPTISTLGNVNVCQPNSITGYAAPNLREVNGLFELLVGSERGYLYRYIGIEGNLNGTFTLLDSIGWNIWEGSKIAPATADLNTDGIADMILGNSSGGINYFQGDSVLSSVNEPDFHSDFEVFPNPAKDEITVKFTAKTFAERDVTIFDYSGRLITRLKTNQPVVRISTSEFCSGIYMLVVRDDKSFSSHKLIVAQE